MAEPYGSARIVYGGHDIVGGPTSKNGGAYAIGGSNAMVLGLEACSWENGCAWIPDAQQGHGLTFGANRCGKGVTSIIPALMGYGLKGYGGSMVVTDPKLENAWTTAPRRRQLGQRVVILDPWNEINERYGSQVGVVEKVTNFNPLANLDPRHPDLADDLASIADALIVPDPRGSSHWVEGARNLIVTLCATVIEIDPANASIGEIRKLLNLSGEQILEYMSKAMKQLRPDGLAAFKLGKFMGDPKNVGEIASIRSTAETQTQIFDSQRLRNAMTSRPGENFDLAELALRPTTLYIGLPVDRVETHGRWLRLILTLAIRAISRQKRPPLMPVLFLLDEFGTLGKLSAVENAFGLMAGLKIRIWAFLQDLSQLKRDYPDSWNTFFANASIVQVLTARDPVTSEYFSDYLGRYTYYTNPDDPRSAIPRPVMTPEEIRTKIGAASSDKLHDCDQLVIYPGRTAHMLRQSPYYTDPRWRAFYRPIPGQPAYLDLRKRNADYNPTALRKTFGLAGSPFIPTPKPSTVAPPPAEAVHQSQDSAKAPSPRGVATAGPPCPECRGAGQVRFSMGQFAYTVTCKTCNGRKTV